MVEVLLKGRKKMAGQVKQDVKLASFSIDVLTMDGKNVDWSILGD